ncbi:acylphosphatase [Guptibacillus hwajinpoensis]|uniref:acylphosphatase n=1 Tax=Guptibacillus hwajinpoensis TaxID=208199 RepID=UPI001CFC6D07|nr:acylphosphatase [Pseudalkalibacillus hwajinpoensis]WLR58353.1 acylphosphatase [Pseudalkalibacillus hwajinpoensis]
MKRYHYIVKGRVQGVGFRAYTQQKAAQYGLTGYVMNRIDSSVEVEAQGEEATLSKFHSALESGSPYSVVDNVIMEEKEVNENERSFTIRY